MIVVSTDHVSVPMDIEDQGMVYRHVNIAVSPTPPSQDSKRVS